MDNLQEYKIVGPATQASVLQKVIQEEAPKGWQVHTIDLQNNSVLLQRPFHFTGGA